MKNFTSGKLVFCALSICALFGATAAQAQNYSVRVDVPFQFIAGEKLYPAGDYKFSVDGTTLKIQAHDTNRTNLVPLAPATDRRSERERDKGMVRFTKAGTVHVLNGVWRAGAVDGNTTYPSRAAKEAVKAGNLTTEIPAGN